MRLPVGRVASCVFAVLPGLHLNTLNEMCHVQWTHSKGKCEKHGVKRPLSPSFIMLMFGYSDGVVIAA